MTLRYDARLWLRSQWAGGGDRWLHLPGALRERDAEGYREGEAAEVHFDLGEWEREWHQLLADDFAEHG